MAEKNIFGSKDIEKTIFDDRWVRFAFGPQGKIDSSVLNLGIVEFEKNTVSSPHKHDVAEALYVLSGKAKFLLDAKAHDINKGDFIHIPEKTEHKVITGDRKIRILFIFGGSIQIDR